MKTVGTVVAVEMEEVVVVDAVVVDAAVIEFSSEPASVNLFNSSNNT